MPRGNDFIMAMTGGGRLLTWGRDKRRPARPRNDDLHHHPGARALPPGFTPTAIGTGWGFPPPWRSVARIPANRRPTTEEVPPDIHCATLGGPRSARRILAGLLLPPPVAAALA